MGRSSTSITAAARSSGDAQRRARRPAARSSKVSAAKTAPTTTRRSARSTVKRRSWAMSVSANVRIRRGISAQACSYISGCHTGGLSRTRSRPASPRWASAIDAKAFSVRANCWATASWSTSAELRSASTRVRATASEASTPSMRSRTAAGACDDRAPSSVRDHSARASSSRPSSCSRLVARRVRSSIERARLSRSACHDWASASSVQGAGSVWTARVVSPSSSPRRTLVAGSFSAMESISRRDDTSASMRRRLAATSSALPAISGMGMEPVGAGGVGVCAAAAPAVTSSAARARPRRSARTARRDRPPAALIAAGE